MLTATEFTGEETQEKKHPKFLLLILALFIMAGVGYTVFLWVFKREKITPDSLGQTVVDASAQAWYDEQKKILESTLNTTTVQVSAEKAAIPAATPEAAFQPTATISEKPKTEVVSKQSLTPAITKSQASLAPKVSRSLNPPIAKRNIHSSTSSSKKVEAFFIPSKNKSNQPEVIDVNSPKEVNSAKEVISNNYSLITKEELERFMQLFPNRKTNIQFIGYTKPTADMDATKNYIAQFLRQNGYTEVSDQWNFWYDHTAIKEVHYGQSGSTGANFYIPNFR